MEILVENVCYMDDIHVLPGLSNIQSELAEGLFYDHRLSQLLWVDIIGNLIYCYDFVTLKLEIWQGCKNPSIIIPIYGNPGKYLTTDRKRLCAWDSEMNQLMEQYGHQLSHEHRFNDGKCDPCGRLYIGSTDACSPPRPGRSALYRLNKQSNPDLDTESCSRDDFSRKSAGTQGPLPLSLNPEVYPRDSALILNTHVLHEIKSKVSISNGIGWSPNGYKMYYIDTPQRCIEIYSYDSKDGVVMELEHVNDPCKVGFGSTIIDLKDFSGIPDGLTVDSRGHIWVAMWDGSQILEIDPKAMEVIGKIPLPVSRPTTCVFGGEDLDQLFIASAKVEGEPLSGKILKLSLTERGIKGIHGSYVRLDI